MISLIALLLINYFAVMTGEVVSDTSDTVEKYLNSEGYPCERYEIETADEYVLTIHRIPPKNLTREVVVLMHGLIGSAADFIMTGRNKGLGNILSDQGYDIWLPNARGSTWSKKHKNLSTTSADYWDFSWHEIGFFDLPAVFDHVLNTTDVDKLHFVGHSQGSTVLFVLLSERPEYNEKVHSIYLLAPTIFLNYLPSPLLHGMADRTEMFEFLQKLFRVHEVLHSSTLNHFVGQLLCADGSFTQDACLGGIYFIVGKSDYTFNMTILPKLFQTIPAGVSAKQIIHFGQLFQSGNFQKFDFKSEKQNYEKYGRLIPPEYNVKNVKISMNVFHGEADALLSILNVGTLKLSFLPVKCLNSGAVKMKKIFSIFLASILQVYGGDIVENLLNSAGYPCEKYEVQTSDGYILTTHRIPPSQLKSNDSPEVVVLMHGLIGSAADFVLAGQGNGLGNILHDQGYDIWMPNARGSTWSRRHQNLTTDSRKYWQYSWHEIGIYDLAATIDQILEETQAKKIHYVGHSQGSTVLFVLLSERPEYNEKFRTVSLVAPAVFLSNMLSPLLRGMVDNIGTVEFILKSLGTNEILPPSPYNGSLGQILCADGAWTQHFCLDLMNVFMGRSKYPFSMPLLPLIVETTPAGISLNQILHFAQLVQDGRFAKFNFKSDRVNYEKYGQLIPTEYNLRNLNIEMTLFYGGRDALQSILDILKLQSAIRHTNSQFIEVPGFNHIDFLFSTEAPRIVYSKIIENMKKSTIRNNILR